MIEIVDDQIHQVQDFKHSILYRQQIGDGGYGIGNPKCVKTVAIAALCKAPPRFIGKDGVADKGIDRCGSGVLEDLARFVQGPSRLYEIVDNNNMTTTSIPILYCNSTIIAFSTRLAAHYNFQLEVFKQTLKAFGGTVVRKSNTVNVGVFESALEQWYRAL